jgi:hypothetical protein
MPSPKLIFAGGSTVLFGIDAAEVQRQLRRPAMNLGLHAALPLEEILGITREAARPGDIVVLALEGGFYESTSQWSTWDFRQALAWNRESLDRLPAIQRLLLYFTASDPNISYDLVVAASDERFRSRLVAPRLETLRPASEIIARYVASVGSAREFAFTLANLDANGDIMNAKPGTHFHGDAWPLSGPAHISAHARDQLVPFLNEMQKRGVRILFDYAPYLVNDKPRDSDWKSADASFRQELAALGGVPLEQRDALFFPAEYFYNTNLHLNEDGRRVRTVHLIQALQGVL